MKARFVYESLGVENFIPQAFKANKEISESLSVLKPKKTDDIEQLYKDATYDQMKEIEHKIPDEVDLQNQYQYIQDLYRDMEAEAPENDDEANEWGRKISKAEEDYEAARKQHNLFFKHLREKVKVLDDLKQLRDNLDEAEIDYEIKDAYYIDTLKTGIDIVIDGEEETFIMWGNNVYLDDFDGPVDFGRTGYTNRWTRKGSELDPNHFLVKLKEYLSLEPEEVQDFLDQNR